MSPVAAGMPEKPMNIPSRLLAPSSLQLPDRRRLAWYEFGDAAGVPCIYTPGTPTGGLAGALYHPAALAAGVRWISVDKPGYGGSDFLPQRRLLDWPRDIRALAAALRLDRFAVAGESGGAPHALALCHAMPERITAGLLFAGFGPDDDPAARRNMRGSNRLAFWLARHAPPLLRMALAAAGCEAKRALNDPAHCERMLQKRLARMPPADRALYQQPEFSRVQLRAWVEATRHGPQAAAQEMKLFASPWGFRISTIRPPVHLWHGSADANVPLAMAQGLEKALPRGVLHVVEGAGHAAAFQCLEPIMATVREAR